MVPAMNMQGWKETLLFRIKHPLRTIRLVVMDNDKPILVKRQLPLPFAGYRNQATNKKSP